MKMSSRDRSSQLKESRSIKTLAMKEAMSNMYTLNMSQNGFTRRLSKPKVNVQTQRLSVQRSLHNLHIATSSPVNA